VSKRTGKEPSDLPAVPVVIVDTREQLPYTFEDLAGANVPAVRTKTATLQTGDYSIQGLESRLCVERKSVSDFYGTITAGRDRFERELKRMQSMERAAVIVEGRFSDVICPFQYGRRISSDAVLGSVASFYARYRVPCYFLANRQDAERFTLKLLIKCWKVLKDCI